ncbi:DUF255 domain-containing protein [Flavicella sp.]|uniref:thioredoxin family protein n=1 Tax=Flavicella sp. TaxID=2957742 RepID=UPI00301ABAAD
MKKYFLTIVFLCASLFQLTAQEINWISFEKAIELNKEQQKNILIDVYTDWCGYCKKMDRDTYKNTVIAELINENFYAVKLNAEQKESILYKDRQYKFISQGRKGYHEFAANLLQGEMSYPSTVFMNKDEQLIQKLPGYLDAKSIEPILLYLGKDKYIEQTWDEFQKEFTSQL